MLKSTTGSKDTICNINNVFSSSFEVIPEKVASPPSKSNILLPALCCCSPSIDSAALVVLSLAKIALLTKTLYEEHQIDSENRLETPRRIAIFKRNVHNVLLHKILKILEKHYGYALPVQNFLHIIPLESHSFLHHFFFASKEFTCQVCSREDRDKKTERRESGRGRERQRPDAKYALQGPLLFNFLSSQQLWVRTPDVCPDRRCSRSMQCQLSQIVVFLSKSRCSTYQPHR